MRDPQAVTSLSDALCSTLLSSGCLAFLSVPCQLEYMERLAELRMKEDLAREKKAEPVPFFTPTKEFLKKVRNLRVYFKLQVIASTGIS